MAADGRAVCATLFTAGWAVVCVVTLFTAGFDGGVVWVVALLVAGFGGSTQSRCLCATGSKLAGPAIRHRIHLCRLPLSPGHGSAKHRIVCGYNPAGHQYRYSHKDRSTSSASLPIPLSVPLPPPSLGLNDPSSDPSSPYPERAYASDPGGVMSHCEVVWGVIFSLSGRRGSSRGPMPTVILLRWQRMSCR